MKNSVRSLKNQYRGQRAFIVGNGPSLSKTPLKRLNDEYTFGMNMIHKIYDDTEWRPSFFLTPWTPLYYAQRMKSIDTDIIQEHKKREIPCFVHHGFTDKYFEWSEGFEQFSGEYIYPLRFFKLQYKDIPFNDMSIEDVRNTTIEHLCRYWSKEVSTVVYVYHAMYVAFQLASYMGFEKIYIIGADLGFKYINPHMIFDSGLDPFRYENDNLSYLQEAFDKNVFLRSLANAVAMKSIQNISIFGKDLQKDDDNHFYSNRLKNWNIEDGVTIEKEIIKSHIAAQRMCAEVGVEIYNATVGGELEVYDRVDINDIV